MMMHFGGFPPFILLVLVGLFFLMARRRRDRRRMDSDRDGRDGELSSSAASRKGTVESEVFRLARDRGGRLRISDLVIDLGLTAKEVEALMDGMADGYRVRAELNADGYFVYEFPELMPPRREGDRSGDL